MRRISAVATLALVALAGCGSGSRVKLVPVKGTVTKAGKPVRDARVAFIPSAQNKDQTPGSDATGVAGNFRVLWNGRLGLAPGRYKVVVTPAFVPPPGMKVPPGMENDPLEAEKAMGFLPGTTPRYGPALKPRDPPGEFDAEVTDTGGVFRFDLEAGSTVVSGK